LLQQAIHIHHESRGTEAALGAIHLGQSLLDGIVAGALVTQSLGGHDLQLGTGIQQGEALERGRSLVIY